MVSLKMIRDWWPVDRLFCGRLSGNCVGFGRLCMAADIRNL